MEIIMLNFKFEYKNKKAIVIKIGTTSLIDEGKLSQPLLHSLAEKINNIKALTILSLLHLVQSVLVVWC